MADEVLVRDPNSVPAIGGADSADPTQIRNIHVDEGTHSAHVGNYIWNPITGAWVESRVVNDEDITFAYTDGKVTTVEITGLGYTKTLTFSWTGSQLDSIACVIT